jgi:soluble epoxide hydrolase / lipid-phosphate phosphatase
MTADLVALLSSLGISKAIYIGHDWGSAFVQRLALWHPENVIAVGALCVPFMKPQRTYTTLEQMVERFPNFEYQIWYASPESEKDLSGPETIERFLKGIFRIKGDKPAIWNTSGDVMKKMGNPSLGRLWNNEVVWKYYLHSFQKKGTLRGPLNYYKTRALNFRDELELGNTPRIQCPALFIGAKKDKALPPSIWESQDWVPQLEKRTVNTGHWCLVEDEGKEIAPLIQAWVAKISKSSKL